MMQIFHKLHSEFFHNYNNNYEWINGRATMETNIELFMSVDDLILFFWRPHTDRIRMQMLQYILSNMCSYNKSVPCLFHFMIFDIIWNYVCRNTTLTTESGNIVYDLILLLCIIIDNYTNFPNTSIKQVKTHA